MEQGLKEKNETVTNLGEERPSVTEESRVSTTDGGGKQSQGEKENKASNRNYVRIDGCSGMEMIERKPVILELTIKGDKSADLAFTSSSSSSSLSSVGCETSRKASQVAGTSSKPITCLSEQSTTDEHGKIHSDDVVCGLPTVIAAKGFPIILPKSEAQKSGLVNREQTEKAGTCDLQHDETVDWESKYPKEGVQHQRATSVSILPKPSVSSDFNVPSGQKTLSDSELITPNVSSKPLSTISPEKGCCTEPVDIQFSSSITAEQTNSQSLFLASSSPAAPQSFLTPPTSSNVVTVPKSQSNQSASLRRGKWTSEEEAYVAQVIHDFNSGYLNAPAGTTLRTYLSEKLQCDPMRITKKFTGDACIGKRVFHPAVRSAHNTVAIDKAQAELEFLERKWRKRLEIQQKESAKKAAASAAATTSSGRQHLSPGLLFANAHQLRDNFVARTAKWLDRASTVLAHNSGEEDPNLRSKTMGISVATTEVEYQLKEMEELISEGPKIQLTLSSSPGLGPICDGPAFSTNARAYEEETFLHTGTPPLENQVGNKRKGCPSTKPGEGPNEPLHRKLCPTPQNDTAIASSLPVNVDTKDAEALVGFLETVRSQNKTEDQLPG